MTFFEMTSAFVIDTENAASLSKAVVTVWVPLKGVPHPVITTDWPSVKGLRLEVEK
jgi:hypothetical protein